VGVNEGDAVPPGDAPDIEQPTRLGGLGVEHHLRLSGELTAANVRLFETTVRIAVQASPRVIVIDLRGIDLIDDHGRTALMKAHLRAKQRGHVIKFVPADHEVVREIIGFTDPEGPDPSV
jgi:anti-anti-sigma regulatory factor